MSTREMLSPVFRAAAGLSPAVRSALVAAALMLVASALFAVQGALVKTGLQQIQPLELVFFRGLVCALAVLAYAKARGLSLATSRPVSQVTLGMIGFISVALYFVSIGMLPLVTATALNYTAPLFIALLVAFRLSRKPAATLIWVAGGFAGICLVLQPSFSGGSSTGVTLALLSGLTGAAAYLLLGKLGRAGEPQRVTAFYFSAAIVVLAGVPMIARGFSVSSWDQAGLVLAIGLIATVAQLAVFKAYAVSTPLIPSTLSYSAVIFSSLLGAWLWGDQLGFWEALGIALIVASGVLVSAGQASAKAAAAPRANDAEEARRRENRRNNLRSLYATYQLGKHPDQVKYVFMMGDAQDNIAEGARKLGEIADPYESAPTLEALWQQRFCPEHYAVDDLLKLPARTLGGAYARHMKANGLRPDFYEDVTPRHKMHYLRLRVRQTHDIWHVLCGFGTDQYGEVGLQGFYFAQFTNGQSGLILASVILKSILRGKFGELELHIEAFCEGYRNGRIAKSLLAVEWERLWGEDIESLRRRFDVEVPRCRAGVLAAASA